MAFFIVEHDAAPLPAFVEAFDKYAAARKFKEAVERANGSQIEDGEAVNVCEISTKDAAPILLDEEGLVWCDSINNFADCEE